MNSICCFRHAEISNLTYPIFVNKQVCRFDVSMDNMLFFREALSRVFWDNFIWYRPGFLLVNRFDILHKTGPSCNLCTAVPFNFFVNAVLPVLVFIAHLVHGLLCYEDAGTQSTSGLRRDETSRLGRQEEETL